MDPPGRRVRRQTSAGTDDFAARGCYNLTDAPWLTNPRFEVTDQNLEKYMGYFKGDYDAEPDMFYFNAGGHSGSCIRRIEEQPTTECRPYHPNHKKSGKDGIQYK